MKERQFDIVLSDINLPDSSGLNLLTQCRKINADTKFILITGAPNIEDAVQTVKEGAFDYLSKPIPVEKLYERVESAITQLHKLKIDETASTKSPSASAGSSHQGYNVIKTLGAGTMGVVLLVERDGKYFAMKILRHEYEGSVNSVKIKRFLREAEILSKITHPNVIKIYEYGISESEEIPYIIMEYMPGKPLNHYMKMYSFTNEQIISIIRQIAESLNAVHAHNILHRDIKPGNILMTQDIKLKLTDFGIAKVSDSNLTFTKEILGSPAYMAPEAFDSQAACDCRSDIFSMGVIAYELLTGVKPFHGETIAEIMNAIKFQRPIEPMKINNKILPYLQDIVAKMLAKKMDERFSSAAEVIKALDFEDAHSQGKEGFTRKLLRTLLLKKPTWD
jgi:serine/threonine protein kinase